MTRPDEGRRFSSNMSESRVEIASPPGGSIALRADPLRDRERLALTLREAIDGWCETCAAGGPEEAVRHRELDGWIFSPEPEPGSFVATCRELELDGERVRDLLRAWKRNLAARRGGGRTSA